MGLYLSGGSAHTRNIGSLLSNPGASVAICDTGPLPSGLYLVEFLFTASAASRVSIRHRNAADSGNIWAFNVDVPADMTIPINLLKDNAATDESYDAVTVTGPGAGETLQGAVWCFAL